MSELSARSILWIEDSPAEIAGTRMSLEREGCEVVTALGAADAVESLRNRHFDLLLVDENLGASGSSGSQLVEQLQAGLFGVENAGIPFAFVTAYSNLINFNAIAQMPGYRGTIAKAGDLTQNLGKALEGLVTVPGLFDAAGKPLESDSPEYRDLVVRFRATTAEVLTALADRPQLLHDLHHREFEELIAELFARNGFEVELTPRTRDHGADLFAVRQTGLGPHRYVIECKRNAPQNRVGPALVRQLRGVVDREGATCGVLVTTSTFTPGAHEEQRTSPYRLSLRDFENVASWLRGDPILD